MQKRVELSDVNSGYLISVGSAWLGPRGVREDTEELQEGHPFEGGRREGDNHRHGGRGWAGGPEAHGDAGPVRPLHHGRQRHGAGRAGVEADLRRGRVHRLQSHAGPRRPLHHRGVPLNERTSSGAMCVCLCGGRVILYFLFCFVSAFWRHGQCSLLTAHADAVLLVFFVWTNPFCFSSPTIVCRYFVPSIATAYVTSASSIAAQMHLGKQNKRFHQNLMLRHSVYFS